MFTKKSTEIYRPLIREALRLTWQRKTLWIFGTFAALISTGGVFDVAANGLQRIQASGSFLRQIFDSSFIGYALFGQYIRQFQNIGSFFSTTLFFFTTLIGIGLLMIAVLSQASLIHGIKQLEEKHPRIVRKEASVHVLSLFIIGAFTKIFSAVLIAITTLPFVWFYAQSSNHSFLVVFLQLLIFFPAILILNIISLLSVIHIVETGDSVTHAIAKAWAIFSKHWLATLEFALLMFLLIAILGIGLFAVIIFLTVPYALVYSISLLSGSSTLFFLANMLFGIVTLIIVCGLGGGIITFQYSAWYLFYKQTQEKIHMRFPLSKLRRLFARG